jgi:hypothetical protein
MKLQEIFDSAINVEWQKNGKFELAGFVSGEKYVIQIERRNFSQFPELAKYKTAEVSFFRYDINNPDSAFSTAPQSINVPVKVYGIVYNAIKSKFSEYDAFYFIAARKHSKSAAEFNSKKEIYASLADKLVKHLSDIFYYENDEGIDAQYLISRVKLSDETKQQTKLTHPLSEALKATGLGKGFY